MRFWLLAGLLVLSLALTAAARDYSTNTVNTLYERGIVPVQLAEVSEIHGCAGENAFVQIEETEKRLMVRITLIENGAESTVFEVTHEPTAYPTGHTYSYRLSRKGEYAINIIYFGELSKRRTFTVDCDYVEPPPAVAEEPPTLPEPPPSAGPGSATGDIGDNVPPAEGEQPEVAVPALTEEQTAAYNAMADALYAIGVSRKAGADVDEARAKYEEAQFAYSSGKYPLAKSLAEEATQLAQNALEPSEAPPEAPPSGLGFSLPSLPSVDPSLILAAGAIAAIAVVALFLYKRRGSGGPPPEERLQPEQLPSSMRPHMSSHPSSDASPEQSS